RSRKAGISSKRSPPCVLAPGKWPVPRFFDPARHVFLMIGLGDQRSVALGCLPCMAFRAAGAAILQAVILAVRIRVHMVIADAKVETGVAADAGRQTVYWPF